MRLRIPRVLLTAYPRGQKEIARSLRTADPKATCSNAILELAAIQREFRAKRAIAQWPMEFHRPPQSH